MFPFTEESLDMMLRLRGCCGFFLELLLEVPEEEANRIYATSEGGQATQDKNKSRQGGTSWRGIEVDKNVSLAISASVLAHLESVKRLWFRLATGPETEKPKNKTQIHDFLSSPPFRLSVDPLCVPPQVRRRRKAPKPKNTFLRQDKTTKNQSKLMRDTGFDERVSCGFLFGISHTKCRFTHAMDLSPLPSIAFFSLLFLNEV